ncbi:glycosyltransferase [Leptolyngbyaceae cyanobacterium CCMR0082]|uniref:Glycosyltransferase n=2 Tax=Adonisia turfae TaxID=2950184 RepID=A0A6M0SGG3_9CYAN|nr:glycosyltransferase [Adonisia turfae]NEZ57048.1 glycosyltransferase [Adonisia turfae CCMR0081]NEZ67565.1 glycosyltransferase [Adonisia turfae CCMR0082]
MKATNVLFLTTLLPSRRKTGGEVASQAFINGLRQNGYKVSVVGYMRKDDSFEPEAHEVLVEKRHIETSSAKIDAILWLLLSFIVKLPYSAAKYYSQTYVKLVNTLLSAKQYDVVFIDHSQLAWLAKLVAGKSKIIFIAHNIEHEIYLSHFNNSKNLFERWLYAREAKMVKRIESELSKQAAEVWTLTEHDANHFSRLKGVYNVKALALPLGPEKVCENVIEKRFDIGLIGSWTWKFNEEGLHWFFKFVYPELSSQLSIHVAGKGAEWLSGKYPNVKYEGFVPNSQVFMAQARVIALPMLGGSGIQIKTLDALASGSAIVATPTSMRGVSLVSPIVQIAEHPKEFAHLLAAEAFNWTTERTRSAEKTTSNWLQTRKEKFLNDIASSVENGAQAFTQMAKSH